jgi:non-ribosomal peptide synthetase component E (peptide arylation enzyme)
MNGIGTAMAPVDPSGSVTYNELETRAPLLRNGLARQGGKPGDAVLVQSAGAMEVAVACRTTDAVLARPSPSVPSRFSSERRWTRSRSSYFVISWATASWTMKSGR